MASPLWCCGLVDYRLEYESLARKQRNKGGRARLLFFARMDVTEVPTVAERLGLQDLSTQQDAWFLFKGGELVGELRGNDERQTVRTACPSRSEMAKKPSYRHMHAQHEPCSAVPRGTAWLTTCTTFSGIGRRML